MPSRIIHNQSISPAIKYGISAAFLLSGFGCDRYPHSKIDVTNISANTAYVSVKTWKVGQNLNCTDSGSCTEDHNLTAYKIAANNPPEHYRIGLHFADTSATYRVSVATFAAGSGAMSGKYCLADRSDSVFVGPFRPNEYFGEVRVPLRPAFVNATIPSVACVSESAFTGAADSIPPLIASIANASELRINETSAPTQPAPPSSIMSLFGWFFRPDSQITISYTTSGSQSSTGTFSTIDTGTPDNLLDMQNRSPDQLTVVLSDQQNASLRGIRCVSGVGCTMNGGGGPMNTTVTVRISGGGGETIFFTTP